MADDRQTGPDDLDRRIAQAKADQRPGVASAESQAESRGWAVGIEFVGTILVSTFLGWLIDHYAGLWHGPWAMIVLLLLGFAAGVRRAMRTSAQFDSVPDGGNR